MRTIWRKRRVRILVLLLIPVCLLFAVGPILMAINSLSQDFAPLSQVETVVGLKVPQTASGVHYRYRSWQGVATYLRFTLTTNEASTYIANLQLGKECSYPSPKDNFSPFGATWDYTDWFKPSLVLTYAGQECFADGMVYYLLVDKTNPTIPTIYLFSGGG
jgi:hypothetical protein